MQDRLLHFITERELIRKRRESGQAAPYTDDPRLRDFWFPNIRRADGKLLQWWHENIAECGASNSIQIFATIACWLFSRVESLEEIKPILIERGWDSQLVLDHFKGRKGLISMHMPTGILPKDLPAICRVMEDARKRNVQYQIDSSLESNTRTLGHIRGVGQQLAFEIACAMRYLPFGRFSDWMYANRGTVRGTALVTGLDLNPNSQYGRQAAQEVAIRLHEESGAALGWDLPDAQKALELFDIYARPKRPGRRYRWK